MNYGVILDGASKAAAGVGVILGLSYAAGLFKMLGFYSAFDAEWLFEMMDVQGFISEGLPMVMMLLLVASFYFFALNKLLHIRRRGWILFFVTVLSSLAPQVQSYFGFDDYDKITVAAAVLGMAGSALLAWIVHCYAHSQSSSISLYHITVSIALILGFCPLLAGKARADNIQYARDTATEIVDSSNRVVGMLVRVVGGKYLILDCRVQGQLSLQEVTPSFRLRKSSGQCRAVI